MTVFKIGLLQINPTKSIENNIKKGIDACNTAKKQGADLALFPEIWQIGYNSKLMTLENAVTHDRNWQQKEVWGQKILQPKKYL